MEPSDQGPTCQECGASLGAAVECAACLARPHGIELKVLPPSPGVATEAAEVRLVRQLKMPTVDHLVTEPSTETLPETMREVEQAVAEGDLSAADEMLESALATVLEGPGHQRRRPRFGFLPLVLWLWCGVLIILLALSLLV